MNEVVAIRLASQQGQHFLFVFHFFMFLLFAQKKTAQRCCAFAEKLQENHMGRIIHLFEQEIRAECHCYCFAVFLSFISYDGGVCLQIFLLWRVLVPDGPADAEGMYECPFDPRILPLVPSLSSYTLKV
jgi:hypothetical protein